MDKIEFENIYNQYFDMVYRICFLYMKNTADAQDMTQDTFCRMYQSSFCYESEEKTKAWLAVTALNCCKNQLKKWWVKKRVPYEEYLQEGHVENQDHSVYTTVMSLHKKYSIPTYLYYYEGYKTGEIAQMLHEKPSTIQTRLAKARQLLKLELEEEKY